MNCANKAGIIDRIGGPDSCVVRPHSKPWMARLVFNDRRQLIQTIYKVAQRYQILLQKQDFSALAKLLQDFDDKTESWIKYFMIERREVARNVLK